MKDGQFYIVKLDFIQLKIEYLYIRLYYPNMAELPNTNEDIVIAILDIICDLEEAKQAQEQDDYESLAHDTICYWQSAVHHIVGLHLDLFPLNNFISSLELSKDEYKLHYRDNLLDLYRTCYAYQPFEALLQGEFGENLDAFCEDMMSDVDTDGDISDVDRDDIMEN
jgi:hypothetical protein